MGDGLCRAFSGGVRIIVAGRVRYPDTIVMCSPLDWDSDIVPEPVAAFEVLSPSTARTDWTLKTEEYRVTPSIRHYILLEQGAEAAHVFTRTADAWDYQLVQKGGALALPAISVSLPLAACYAGIIEG